MKFLNQNYISLIREFLCQIGLHKWGRRELHADEPLNKDTHMYMTIVERCECGASRIPCNGESKLTHKSLFISSKYLQKDV